MKENSPAQIQSLPLIIPSKFLHIKVYPITVLKVINKYVKQSHILALSYSKPPSDLSSVLFAIELRYSLVMVQVEEAIVLTHLI